MARTTRKDVDNALELLTRHLDLDALAKRYGAGKLHMDYYNPGDNPHAYKIVWVSNEHGGHYEPFGSLRCRANEMIDKIHFLTNANYAGIIATNYTR